MCRAIIWCVGWYFRSYIQNNILSPSQIARLHLNDRLITEIAYVQWVLVPPTCPKWAITEKKIHRRWCRCRYRYKYVYKLNAQQMTTYERGRERDRERERETEGEGSLCGWGRRSVDASAPPPTLMCFWWRPKVLPACNLALPETHTPAYE